MVQCAHCSGHAYRPNILVHRHGSEAYDLEVLKYNVAIR